VVFSIGGRMLANESWSPFAVVVGHASGNGVVTARVTFTDSTPAKTLRMRFKACAAAKRQVSPSRNPRRPPGFTG
jgi:hypothetical protein